MRDAVVPEDGTPGPHGYVFHPFQNLSIVCWAEVRVLPDTRPRMLASFASCSPTAIEPATSLDPRPELAVEAGDGLEASSVSLEVVRERDEALNRPPLGLTAGVTVRFRTAVKVRC